MAAPRELVFDVIAEPYLGRAPRALAAKLRVLERGSDMVLAAHFTPLGGRLGLVAQTVETVRFTRPERVDFRLVRGPVPHVVEAFVLSEQAGGPARGWPTAARSGPTCGGRGSTGVRWWRAAGSRRWRPRWPRSRSRLNGARRAPQELTAPAPTHRAQPPADSLPSPLARSTQPGRATPRPAIRYAGGSMRAPAARIAASARSPSPGCNSTARTSPPKTTVSNPNRTASSAVSFTQ